MGKSVAVIPGATGVEDATAEEQEALAEVLPSSAVRATGNRIGHTVEAQFPFGIAFVVLALRDGKLPASASDFEKPAGAPDTIVVTSVGHKRGEGAAVVRKA